MAPQPALIDFPNHDPELEDAKWVTLAEVKEALRVGTSGLGEEAGEANTMSSRVTNHGPRCL